MRVLQSRSSGALYSPIQDGSFEGLLTDGEGAGKKDPP